MLIISVIIALTIGVTAKKLDKIVSYTYYAAYSTLSDVSRQLLGDFDPNNEVYMAIHKPAFVEKLFNSFFGKAVAAGDEVPVNWDFAQVDCDVCITTAYSGWLEDCVATSYDSEGFPKTFACPYFDGADILQHSRLRRNTNFKECGNALGADGTPGQGPMTYAYRSDVAARSPFKNIYKTTCNYPCYTQEQYNNFDNANYTDLEPCIGENCNCGSYVETEYRVYTNSFPCGTTYGVPDPGLCITCPSGYRIKRGSGYSEEAPLKNISCVPINPQPPVNDDTTPTTPDDSNNPDNSGGNDNTGGDTVTEPTCDIPTPSLDATPCGKRWDGSPEVCGFVDINPWPPACKDSEEWNQSSCSCIPKARTLPRKGQNFCEQFEARINSKSGTTVCTGDLINSNTTDFSSKTPDIVLRNGMALYNVRQNPTQIAALANNTQAGSYTGVPNTNEYGYTVYVDIDGKSGDSKLWEDVYPFYMTLSGRVIPAYDKDVNPQGAGGDSSKYLQVSVQQEGINVRGNRTIIWLEKSVPFNVGACRMGYVGKNTPYCSGLEYEEGCGVDGINCKLKKIVPIRFF